MHFYGLENNDTIRDEYIKVLELLRTSMFSQITGVLATKKLIIISLKLGYVDEKKFITESLAKFLGIYEEEVRKQQRK